MSGSPPPLAVVIPCHDEPDPLVPLLSLRNGAPPPDPCDVMVVVNGRQGDPLVTRLRDDHNVRLLRCFADDMSDERMRFNVLDATARVEPKWGVGWARKLGMDAVAKGFMERDAPHGVIISLDADCRVDPDYLPTIANHFALHPDSPGAAIHFEHPLDDCMTTRQRQGIAAYELYLRYYRWGLRWAGHPHAFHTVGSSFAVRAGSYTREGGMNRRQGGEDFYFLHKIIPLGQFSEITTTTVYPSPRSSQRVPFGTGRAMSDWLASEENDYLTWSPEIFRQISLFIHWVSPCFIGEDLPQAPPSPTIATFAQQWKVTEKLTEIRRNTATAASFRKRFFNWFNAFAALKFIRLATPDTLPVQVAAARLWQWMGHEQQGEAALEEWLHRYRRLDRGG